MAIYKFTYGTYLLTSEEEKEDFAYLAKVRCVVQLMPFGLRRCGLNPVKLYISWMAGLSWSAWLVTVSELTHPTIITNRAQHRATSLAATNALKFEYQYAKPP